MSGHYLHCSRLVFLGLGLIPLKRPDHWPDQAGPALNHLGLEEIFRRHWILRVYVIHVDTFKYYVYTTKTINIKPKTKKKTKQCVCGVWSKHSHHTCRITKWSLQTPHTATRNPNIKQLVKMAMTPQAPAQRNRRRPHVEGFPQLPEDI